MRIPALFFSILVFFTSLTSAPTPPQSSEPYIEISGQRLRLGMTKAQVSEKLAGTRIKKMDEDFWGIGATEPMPEALRFTGGKLTYASRSWSSETNDIFESLFGAVSTLNEQGLKNCRVTTTTAYDPAVSSKIVWIVCGAKELMISRLTMSGKSYNMVDERLGEYKPR